MRLSFSYILREIIHFSGVHNFYFEVLETTQLGNANFGKVIGRLRKCECKSIFFHNMKLI